MPRPGEQESLFVISLRHTTFFFSGGVYEGKCLLPDNNIFRLFSTFPDESPESNSNLLGIQQPQLLLA